MHAWGSSPAKSATGRPVENKEAKEARWLSAYRNALRLHAAVPKEGLTADNSDFKRAWDAYAALLDDNELPSDAKIRFFCYKNQAVLEEAFETVDLDRVVQLQLQATEVDGTDRSLWLQIARNATRLNRPKLTRAALEQVLQLVPDHVAGLSMLRDALANLGDRESADLFTRRLRELGAVSLPQSKKPAAAQQSADEDMFFDTADTSHELVGELVGPSWHLLGQLLLRLHSDILDDSSTHTFSSPVVLKLRSAHAEQGMSPPLIRRPDVQAAFTRNERAPHQTHSNASTSEGSGKRDKGKGKAKAKGNKSAPAQIPAARASKRIQERSYEEDQNAAESELVSRLAKQLTEGLVDKAGDTASRHDVANGATRDADATTGDIAQVTQSQERTQEALSSTQTGTSQLSPKSQSQSRTPSQSHLQQEKQQHTQKQSPQHKQGESKAHQLIKDVVRVIFCPVMHTLSYVCLRIHTELR